MSREMAHKVIVPQKKNYVPQFLKQRDINSYFIPLFCWGFWIRDPGAGIWDPRSGIRDPGWVKIRIRDKHPACATLLVVQQSLARNAQKTLFLRPERKIHNQTSNKKNMYLWLLITGKSRQWRHSQLAWATSLGKGSHNQCKEWWFTWEAEKARRHHELAQHAPNQKANPGT